MNPDLPAELQGPWREFLGHVENRLVAGAREYGAASLRAPAGALAAEVEEELLDVMGWGFLLWIRMRGIADRLKETK